MEKINLFEVQKSLTGDNIIDIVTSLGADRYVDKISYIVFPTICHNECSEDASMKLYYYKNTGLFTCYTDCGESFNIYTLIEKVYELRGEKIKFSDVIDIVLKKSGLDKTFSQFGEKKYHSIAEKYRRKERRRDLEIFDEKVLNAFEKKYPVEWIAEGITPESMDKYNIRYSISRNKIIIPHYDIDGNLIGIRGRALDEEEAKEFGKYMPVEIEGKWYSFPLSQNLYGLNISKDAIKRKKKVIIFEGEKSTYKYDKLFEDNISCASCGSSFNKSQLEILLRNFDLEEIIIAFDKEYEKYNNEKGKNYFSKLENICNKYSNYCNFSFIFDKENLLKLKDSPIDRGKNIFLQLYEKRIKIRSVLCKWNIGVVIKLEETIWSLF